MAFRSPDNVQRFELIRFQLQDNIRASANGREHLKKKYKLNINDGGNFYDWFNSFFEVGFKLDLNADAGAVGNTRTTIINGYDTDNLPLVTFVKNKSEYSDDYARSVAKNRVCARDVIKFSNPKLKSQ